MQRKSSRTVSARIHRLTGQLQAIEEMIAKRRDCPQVLHQIGAVRAGIEQVAAIVLQNELQKRTAKRKLDPHELADLLTAYNKVT